MIMIILARMMIFFDKDAGYFGNDDDYFDNYYVYFGNDDDVGKRSDAMRDIGSWSRNVAFRALAFLSRVPSPPYPLHTHGTTNWFSVIDDTKQPYNQPCSQPSNQLLPTNQIRTKQITKKPTIPTN